MRQDPAFKDIFAYGFMVEELMRWFVGDLHGGREPVDALDFSLLLRVQEQSTTGRAGDKRSYANDIVWRVPFRGRPADGGDRAWLHLVLMIEVQGEVDHLMALRVRNYVDNHHLELWRGRRFGAVDRLAPVLPIVIYTGPSRWTAALWVIDLVTPGASDGVAADVSSRASRLFSGDGYLTVDTMRLPADDLRRDNAAALLAGLCNPTLEHVPAQAAALRARLNAPELRPLLETVLGCWRQCWRGCSMWRSATWASIWGLTTWRKWTDCTSPASSRSSSRRVVGPTRTGTVPRAWREASNRGLPPSGSCCAGRRRASSARGRPGGWRACSPGSATPTSLRRRGTGSSTALQARS